MELMLNGHPVSADPPSGATMLDLLRDECGITSVKDGCAPEGSCGACTVLVDGKAVVSCAQPATRAAGKHIVTQEGLSPGQRDLWASSFVAAGASQCGFCSPGIVMKAESLLAKNLTPSRDEVARALAGNLCRCTGYVKVVDAVQVSLCRGPTGPAGSVPAPAGTWGRSSPWATSPTSTTSRFPACFTARSASRTILGPGSSGSKRRRRRPIRE